MLYQNGKWHEVTSLFHGWAALAKQDKDAPVRMEALLKRLLQEQEQAALRLQEEKNTQTTSTRAMQMVDIGLYNTLLDAWACAALFKTHDGINASQRAREILVTLQETFETTGHANLQPDARSFEVTLHAVTRLEGPLVARRLLAWKEHLYKTDKNRHAKPSHKDYLLVLDAYSNMKDVNAGALTEGLVSHMKATGIVLPDTYCYNIVIKAWTRSKRGREAAEHAERIMEEMDTEPDLHTYASVITAWANSGMQKHAVSRVEELLRAMENHPELEPNTVVLNAVLSAWVKARTPASVNRTLEILQQMEETGQADLISYNTHMHALAVHGREPGNARRAEQLLDYLEGQADPDLQPNLFSYNCALESLSKSTDKDAAARAIAIFRRIMQRGDMNPDTFAFNQLLVAVSRAPSIPDAGDMARRWLAYMEKSYVTKVFPRARPDSLSYASAITAYARSGVKGSAFEAERLFEELHEKYKSGRKELKPTRILYNSMIDCWAKSKEGTLGARKAEALLRRMEEMSQAGDASMQPNLISYNGVLNAWAKSNTRCCALKAETYLERMWELHQNGNQKVKPDHFSYNTVISAISKSKHARKAQRALRVLRMMDMLYRSGQTEARPSEITYTAVLQSCAFPVARDPRSRRKALDTALFTLAEVQQSEYCRPNEATYGTFIRACANLLHDDVELRRRIIEKAFKECCQDGQAGDVVLNFFRKAAPADLYEELLSDFVTSGTVITAKDLPAEWRCNVNVMHIARPFQRSLSP